jgi:hypothetical protein
VKKRRRVETSEDLVCAFADLFNEVAPETPEEIDGELCAAGYDPDKIGARMQAAAEQSLANSPLNWRSRAQRQLEVERARIAGFVTTLLRSRAEIIAAIRQLVAQSGGQMVYAHRNFESETDEDLASLLADLEYLASQQRGRSEE